MMGSHLIMDLTEANLQVHFPITLEAADRIPGDNASGMNETHIFYFWQHSRSQKVYTRKFKTIKMSSATGRINDNQKSVFLK